MKNAKLWISKLFFPILLTLIVGVLTWQNYTPGTFLSGWDTLHPEFNFSVAFNRMLNGVWRSDQGLGAVAIQSHMADLPRVILLWMESFILPLNMLRYSYFWLILLAGPLGMYFLIKNVIPNSFRDPLRSSNNAGDSSSHKAGLGMTSMAAFIAALIYLFNLGTVQHFSVPLEMFAAQYGLLPWAFLAVINVFNQTSRKNILVLALVSFLISAQAHTATLAYAYFLMLGVYLLTKILLNVSTWKVLAKKSFVIIMITFAMNAYWFLPNIYTVINHADDVRNSKVNQLFTPEAFAKNQMFGNLENATVLKNFLFDWQIFKFENNRFEYMLQPWKDHLQNPWVMAIGYSVFALSLAGIAISILKKNKTSIPFLPIFAISLFVLLNGSTPVGWFFDYLGQLSPLLKEALRFPFTKFSILLMFSLSIFAGVAIDFILYKIRKIKILASAITLGLSTALFIYFWPAFQGNLIHPSMRITYPKEYFEMFEWFEEQNGQGRVAILPIHSFWNWAYYSWGYQGAGFLQFGVPQPILDRDYDRWNPFNEQYYREMSTAIYSRDENAIEKLVRKYGIRYFLLDTNIMAPGNKANVFFYEETKTTLERSDKIKLVKNYNDRIFIYEIADESESLIYTPNTFAMVNGSGLAGYHDQKYLDYGDYIASDSLGTVYPFSNVLKDKELLDETKLSLEKNQLLIQLDSGFVNENSLKTGNTLLPKIVNGLSDQKITDESKIIEQNNKLYIAIPISSEPINLAQKPAAETECGKSQDTLLSKREVIGDYVSFQSLRGSVCDFVTYFNVKHDTGALLYLEARNISGYPLRICVSNHISTRCDLDTAIEQNTNWKKYYFLIPPLPDGHSGYDVHLSSISFGLTKTVNDVRELQLIPIPYYWLSSLYLGENQKQDNGLSLLATNELASNIYEVELNINNEEGLFVLNQAFEKGWIAYRIRNNESGVMKYLTGMFPYVFGERLTEHVLVNNWANGWKLDGSIQSAAGSENKNLPLTANSQLQTIYLVFWPQVLEFIGFALLPIPFLFLLKKKWITKA